MKKLILFLIFHIQFSIFSFCNAQPGTIDSTFGVNGVVRLTINPSLPTGFCRKLIPLPDGKVIAAGSSNDIQGMRITIARLNNDGVLDSTFGTQGITKTAINSSMGNFSYCAVRLANGKILLGGNASIPGFGDCFAVARYTPDGIPDSSFSGDGVDFFPVNGATFDSFGYAIALQSDGKVILAGTTSNGSNYDFAVLRFLANGGIDTSFGNMGATVTSIGSNNDYCYSMTVQSDDKIVLAGTTYNGSKNVFALARYEANGLLDPTFGISGILIYSLGLNVGHSLSSVVIQQPDNKIIIGGSVFLLTNDDFAMLRFDSLGVIDNSFGIAGLASIDFSGSGSVDRGRDIGFQPDGKILLSGESLLFGSSFGLARFDSNGNPDNTFGNAGLVYLNLEPGNHYGYSTAIDVNNKILLGGQISNYPGFYIARFNSELVAAINSEQQISSKKLFVYPNPTSHAIFINVSTDFGEEGDRIEFKIMDVTGKICTEKLLNFEYKIQVNVHYTPGIYFVQLRNENKIATQMLIIQE